LFFFCFFQAEDGIRDDLVTGVQTCALPILRYSWIAAWLARLGFVRFCLARLARGSPRLGWAAASAFGVGAASAVQRIAGEIRKLPAPILPIVRELWSQPKNFMSLGQHLVALPVSA